MPWRQVAYELARATDGEILLSEATIQAWYRLWERMQKKTANQERGAA